MSPQDSGYQDRRRRFRGMLTVYGRKSVLESLRDTDLRCHALHLAESNRDSGIIRDMLSLAEQRGIPVQRHSREALSRISRNGRQDQGVAADIVCPAFQGLEDYLAGGGNGRRLLALDGITNPQNAGMIIRSAVAAGVDGIIYPDRGTAALGPLLIKASVGTVFRAPSCALGHQVFIERLKGGVAPITKDLMRHYDRDVLRDIILDGIPGTAMPPWRPLMSEAEALWIADYLRGVEE